MALQTRLWTRGRLQRFLSQERRLPRQRRAPRHKRLSVGALAQLVVPLSALDALQFALQLVVSLLLGADLLDDFLAVRGIQLVDELGDEVLVLQRLLDRGQRRARLLPLPRVRAIPAGIVAGLGLLVVQLAPQPLQVKVAQGIRAQAAALEVLVGGNVRVLLQQVRDAAKDAGADAIGMQALEQQERLEGGVGSAAVIHPPRPVGVRGARRAMGRGR
jgi:hypothetical protein